MSKTNGNIVEHSTQYIDNMGFNADTKLKSVEIGGTDGSSVNRLKVNSDGSINVSGGSSSGGKATDAYAWQATSDDGTYKYFFFENATPDYYILRKHKTTKVATYDAGTGSYTAVYQSDTLGPSGTPTWATYGATF